MNYTCEFCKKTFAKESTVAVHMCEPKRRRREQTERGVQLGLQAYLQFYKTMQGSAQNKTFEDFADSPYYRAFVKWGRYCVNTQVINPSRFLDWLLRKNKKIDNWASDLLYTEYLIEYLSLEQVSDALERGINFSLDWADRHQAPPQDCIRYGNHNQICHAVTTGRISPWIIYNCESGQNFLCDLTADQLAMIWPYVNSDHWQQKFRDYPADQEYARHILAQAGW
jgi:hypothetical protein